MYQQTRSYAQSLETGATDGSYRKVRPDTTLSPMNAVGDELVTRSRRALNPLDGFQETEMPDKVSPGAGYRGSGI